MKFGGALGELIGRLGLLWLKKRPLSKKSRRKRRISKGKCICDAELADEQCPIHGGSGFREEEGGAMLKGKRTYLGIATIVVGTVLGWLGFGECDQQVVSECVSNQAMTERVMALIDELITVVGIALATYGRAKVGK